MDKRRWLRLMALLYFDYSCFAIVAFYLPLARHQHGRALLPS